MTTATTCQCGMWPIEEYGEVCPSCKEELTCRLNEYLTQVNGIAEAIKRLAAETGKHPHVVADTVKCAVTIPYSMRNVEPQEPGSGYTELLRQLNARDES